MVPRNAHILCSPIQHAEPCSPERLVGQSAPVAEARGAAAAARSRLVAEHHGIFIGSADIQRTYQTHGHENFDRVAHIQHAKQL